MALGFKTLQLLGMVLLSACGAPEKNNARTQDTNTTNAANSNPGSGDATGATPDGNDNVDNPGNGGQPGSNGGNNSGGNKPGVTPAPKADPQKYFTNAIIPMFQANCVQCHADPRQPAQVRAPLTIYTYPSMKTLLGMGKSSETNGLYEKVRNITAHTGGDRCADSGNTASPCKEIIAWWHMEYGEDPADPGARGKIADVSSLGRVTGYAFDPADVNVAVTVTFYADGAKGTGTMLGTTVANIDGVDAATPGAHSFQFDLPENLKDAKPHMLYGYVTIGGMEKPLNDADTGTKFTSYGFTTAGRNYYEANIKGKLTACAACHTVSYEQQFYSLISPAPNAGATATNNQLINKPSQSNGTTHGGGQRCANANASPCLEFQTWWTMEFVR